MQVELGLWRGTYLNHPEQLWLRWWDESGNLLLTGKEEAEVERHRASVAEERASVAEERANLAQQQAQQEQQKRSQLTEHLKSLSPEQLQALGISLELLD
ncbi:MAG TPA: hypothetical protein DDZ80_19900 [Cyanobacteria bacterium UBA8803]|nr:hypothetical protein [Cyanobacteria bacterium UBA8803]